MEERRGSRGFRLEQGIGRRHLIAYFVILFISSIYLGVMNGGQPFVLTEYLHLPVGQHGRASGTLLVANELVMIVLVGVFGVLSDRIGRAPVYAVGFLLAALGIGLYTFASSLEVLVAFRMVYASGAAAITGMMVAVLTDYVRDEDRGRANGWQGFVAGAGAIFMFLVIMQLPRVLAGAFAWSAATAGHATYLSIAAIGVIAAILSSTLLHQSAGRGPVERPKLSVLAREGSMAARRDPRIALAYAAAFVSRGDLAVAGVFVMAWINKHLIQAGVDPTVAIAKAGAIGGIAPITATLAAPVWGRMTDRLDRVVALSIVLILGALAYGSVYFVADPVGPGMMLAVAAIGVVEIGGFVASQALIAQQAPAGVRGSIIGFFGLAGALGILAGTRLGGIAFDLVGEQSPFVLFGLLNALVAVLALYVHRDRNPAAAAEPTPTPTVAAQPRA